MKKTVILTCILLGCIFITLAARADTIEKDKGYISVNASDSKEISPNLAEMTIGIETSDKSLQKASEDNKQIANNVYSKLKILLGKDDYIKTSNYNVRTVYIYTKENKRVLDKYTVNNTIFVRTKKIDMLSTFIDTAIKEGATNINNLQFSAVDYDNNCNEALSELTKKAYTQANAIAKSINSQITGIKSISTTCNLENNPAPYFAMALKSSMDSASATSTPILSGKTKIYANIDASFYVK